MLFVTHDIMLTELPTFTNPISSTKFDSNEDYKGDSSSSKSDSQESQRLESTFIKSSRSKEKSQSKTDKSGG